MNEVRLKRVSCVKLLGLQITSNLGTAYRLHCEERPTETVLFKNTKNIQSCSPGYSTTLLKNLASISTYISCLTSDQSDSLEYIQECALRIAFIDYVHELKLAHMREVRTSVKFYSIRCRTKVTSYSESCQHPRQTQQTLGALKNMTCQGPTLKDMKCFPMICDVQLPVE